MSCLARTGAHASRLAGDECYDKRAELNQPLDRFSLSAYFAYLFYFPLYLTGPTISFGAFVSQVYVPQRAMSTRRVLVYGLRVCATMLLLEVMLHYFYVVAISKHTDSWGAYLCVGAGSSAG
jgi:D-alanyl-lipoteichoic acid acyltransferase DltB (MBOAT superfamily)